MLSDLLNFIEFSNQFVYFLSSFLSFIQNSLLSHLDLDKMSTKFTEYKGLDLPTVASVVLDFLWGCCFEDRLQMDYRIHHNGDAIKEYFFADIKKKGSK
jgi:hypothetical protein